MSLGKTQLKFSEGRLIVDGDLRFNDVDDVIEESSHFLASTQSTSVVIDLEKVRKIDSAGIALLLEWKRNSMQYKKDFRLINVQKQAQSLINTYQLDSLFLP